MPKLLVRTFGVALVASGLLWTLQGLGLIMWPQQSFMLGESDWVGYGIGTAIAGLALLWLAGRKGPGA